MRVVFSSVCFAALAAAAPVFSFQDNSPTLWAEASVTAMKASVHAVYNQSLYLYNRRTIFDKPHASCQSPPEAGQSNSTVCAQADQLVAASQQSVVKAWHDVAAAMFPVAYGLPDNANEPRASYSDFSHFYNYLFIEISTLANITQWYICNGRLVDGSATDAGLQSGSPFTNGDLDLIRFGPYNPTRARNGTDYQPSGRFERGKFFNSYYPNLSRLIDSYFYASLLMSNIDDPESVSICADLTKPGLFKPTPPKNFPPRHLTARRT